MTAIHKSKIDSQIVSYEKYTGVKITIVIASYYGYKEYNKDNIINNEVVLFIVPEKKFYTANVGVGLQKWITNEYASIVLSRNVSQAFDSQTYYQGLESIVLELINKIGYMSERQRTLSLLIDEVRADTQRAILVNYIMMTLSITGLFLIVYFPMSRKNSLSNTSNKKVVLEKLPDKKVHKDIVDDSVVEEMVK
jgi:uncharacterized membrane protein YgcG